MATFLLSWERLGFLTDRPDELENWHDCYMTFSGPLHKTRNDARNFVNTLKNTPCYGKTRRYRIYKFVEAVE